MHNSVYQRITRWRRIFLCLEISRAASIILFYIKAFLRRGRLINDISEPIL